MPYFVHDHCLRYRPNEWDRLNGHRDPKQLRIITANYWNGTDVAHMCETFRVMSELGDWVLDKMLITLGLLLPR
jgi:hypothetical protein